jgi:hypothetical protein
VPAQYLKYTTVRAAVAIDKSGRWRILGVKDDKDSTIEDILRCDGMDNAVIYWISARIPIPHEFTAEVLILPDESATICQPNPISDQDPGAT